ncbi:MAG: nicotinate phosphoribosyltransferase [Candidatus Schekmanbacteria bacterium]|nr:MAG: nicotinate phosphoribosyltransferase [Candidatus Schekmanbacteria bacterium]
MFHIATEKDITDGKITDVYFERTVEILKKKGKDAHVVAEVVCRELPDNREWAVLAGIDECLKLLEKINVNVRALPEGSIFRAGEPVLEIEGMYTDFCKYETAILGFLCQASGIATRASSCKIAAGKKTVLSFGARRMHPAIAPMIERSAYIGGCDGVAVIKSGEELGIKASGTMPHSLIILMGDTVEAAKAFDEVIDPSVERIVLIDTFNDEKIEAMRVAEALGKKFSAVRLDTPRSRRGIFREIVREVRWELDHIEHGNVKIFVSGGITDKMIEELRDIVDGFGVGTFISNAPVVDFSMDIVEVNNQPFSKRGKLSGRKSVLYCPSCGAVDVVAKRRGEMRCRCGDIMEEKLLPAIKEGKIIIEERDAQSIRKEVLEKLKKYAS